MDDDSVYCPICEDVIVPEVSDDGNLLYIHKDIEHTDEDLDALWNGVQ